MRRCRWLWQHKWWSELVCRPNWLAADEARGGGAVEHCCGARRRAGELPGAQAKHAVLLRWRYGGGGMRTTSAAAAEEEEDDETGARGRRGA